MCVRVYVAFKGSCAASFSSSTDVSRNMCAEPAVEPDVEVPLEDPELLGRSCVSSSSVVSKFKLIYNA